MIVGRTRESGASVVEFAILAPLLFLLIFGIIEMSRAVFAYTTVWSAAREGARFATTVEADNYINCSGIETAALAKTVATDAQTSNVSITYSDSSGTTLADCDTADAAYPDPTNAIVVGGTQVEVSITGVSFDSVVPVIEIFLDGLTLDSSQTRTIFVSQQVGG